MRDLVFWLCYHSRTFERRQFLEGRFRSVAVMFDGMGYAYDECLRYAQSLTKARQRSLSSAIRRLQTGYRQRLEIRREQHRLKALEKQNRHSAWLLVRSILQTHVHENWILLIRPRIRYELSSPNYLKAIYRDEPIVVTADLNALFPLVNPVELPEQLIDYGNELHAIVSINKPIQIMQPRPPMMRGLSDEELQQFIANEQQQTMLLKDGMGLKLWADGTLRSDTDDVMYACGPDILFQPESTIAYPFLEPIFPWPVFGLVAVYV